MAKGTRHRNRIELLQGTLDLLILQTLQWGPQHGYGISQAIRTNSGDVLRVDTGSLYPALHRLERQGGGTCGWRSATAWSGARRPSRREPPPGGSSGTWDWLKRSRGRCGVGRGSDNSR